LKLQIKAAKIKTMSGERRKAEKGNHGRIQVRNRTLYSQRVHHYTTSLWREGINSEKKKGEMLLTK